MPSSQATRNRFPTTTSSVRAGVGTPEARPPPGGPASEPGRAASAAADDRGTGLAGRMATLFSRDVQVAVLASGSSGNCTYIGDGHAGVLVDCGISAKQVLARLDRLGLGDAPIDAVLVTHEHGDHVGGARVLCDRLHKRLGRWVPFLMTRGTRDALRDRTTPAAVELVSAGGVVELKHLRLDPFSVPHDVADPVAWRVQLGGHQVGVITDLGRPTTLVQDKLRSLSIAVLEFNHDFELLMGGAYPWHLKQRIRSSHGHLSNDQAGELLERGLGESLRHLVLAHLSDENNQPARALAAATGALRRAGASDRVQVQVAEQRTPLAPIRLPAVDW
ncbi:MAG: MBL fold metallo-hydrolase [Deltaproteobacteria bacterium]|nr:MAG: MBL fold metallo-hydrolase [Deltaproteobacteria bacterium]